MVPPPPPVLFITTSLLKSVCESCPETTQLQHRCGTELRPVSNEAPSASSLHFYLQTEGWQALTFKPLKADCCCPAQPVTLSMHTHLSTFWLLCSLGVLKAHKTLIHVSHIHTHTLTCYQPQLEHSKLFTWACFSLCCSRACLCVCRIWAAQT